MRRYMLNITGIVQGVGFRSLIYNVAKSCSLTGFVRNNSEGISAQIQGETSSVNTFIKIIRANPPPTAVIEKFLYKEIPCMPSEAAFIIDKSYKTENKSLYVSPDLTICENCLHEFQTPSNRRYKYPFTSCSNCGARFTIIHALPYDRQNTSMKQFEMCDECRLEYESSENRRFLDQPISCPKCGPKAVLIDAASGQEFIQWQEILDRQLEKGKIIAFKDNGGFRLVCNAQNENTVLRMRSLKRSKKPFAVMAKNVSEVKRFCKMSITEKKLLTSIVGATVILKKKSGFSWISSTQSMGVMIAHTPLQHMLFSSTHIKLLAVTSANISTQPMIYTNDKAINELGSLADSILIHSRDICIPIEDSIVYVFEEREYLLRRGRGYSPMPIDLCMLGESGGNIFACGGSDKSSFCVTKEDKAFLSEHLYGNYDEGIVHYNDIFEFAPTITAYEKELPKMFSNAKSCVKVQHHHAHAAACMAENGLSEEVMAVVLDNALQCDGGIYSGSEFMLCDYKEFKTLAHFEYVSSKSDSPWDLKEAYIGKWVQNENYVSCDAISAINAAAALLGVCEMCMYEEEAMTLLEEVCDINDQEEYIFDIESGVYGVSLKGIFRQMEFDLMQGIAVCKIAMRFHRTFAALIAQICVQLREQTSINKVALSGQLFLNRLMLSLTLKQLMRHGFEIFIHSKVPPSNSGISLGQAAIAYAVSRP